jgi:hypothetical protein
MAVLREFDPMMRYNGDEIFMIDPKHRIVIQDAWRNVLAYRLGQHGFDPEKPDDRVLTLVKMQDDAKRPYLEIVDRIAYARLFSRILRNEDGLDHRNIATVCADSQWRFTIPIRCWEHARFGDRNGITYAYLLANPEFDLETIMLWDPTLAVDAGLLAADHPLPRGRQKNS